MTQTLQEALLKAGLVSKEKLKKPERGKKGPVRKAQGSPQPSFRPEESPSVLHEGKHEHHLRTECESCKKTSPDVEYYDHKNRLLSVKWLCVKCADHYKVADACRMTEQSQFAKNGMFQREYGATKEFK